MFEATRKHIVLVLLHIYNLYLFIVLLVTSSALKRFPLIKTLTEDWVKII